jgi:flagellar assembly protein FliH
MILSERWAPPQATKGVRFVPIGAPTALPEWLEPDPETGPDTSTLYPPELPQRARESLAPILESLPPAPTARGASSAPRPSVPPPAPRHAGLEHATPSVFPRAESAPSVPPPADGRGEGRRSDTLVEQLAPRVEEEALEALLESIKNFNVARALQLEEAERELSSLVPLIVRRVLARQISLEPGLVLGLITEGLGALAQSDTLNLRLGSFFADALPWLEQQLATRGVRCVARIDPTLSRYGCVLETELGRVDESLETRLDRILSELFEGR